MQGQICVREGVVSAAGGDAAAAEAGSHGAAAAKAPPGRAPAAARGQALAEGVPPAIGWWVQPLQHLVPVSTGCKGGDPVERPPGAVAGQRQLVMSHLHSFESQLGCIMQQHSPLDYVPLMGLQPGMQP